MTLSLQNYIFDELSMCQETDSVLLKHAMDNGFYKNSNKYNKLFSNLFFGGGKLNFKKDLNPDFKKRAVPYLKSIMQSFEPKHEHKAAVSALLLSQLVEIV